MLSAEVRTYSRNRTWTIFATCLAVTAVSQADSTSNQTGPGFDQREVAQDNAAYVRDLAAWTGTGTTAIAQDNEFYARDLALWYRYGLRG